MAFFDEPEHETDELTEVLENDVEILNGASIEMLGPYIEGIFGILAAIGFSLYEERDFFLYCLPAYPVLIFAAYMMWKYQKGIIIFSEEHKEEADDFATEMIVNYQTSQSFGFIDPFVEKYTKILKKDSMRTRSSNLCVGMLFGLAEGCFIASFAYLFYVGIWFTQDNFNEEENGFDVEAD